MSERATRIGNVGSPYVAFVDSRGRVTACDESWSLDWWINADDGWHVASTERGSRMAQRLLDASPVVETTMRVPGGDVLHRAYAIAGGDECIVVEVTNRSPVPVAVAFATSCEALLLPRPPADRHDGAFVYPLPHTATIRVLLPLDPASPVPPVPTSVPTAEQVASGWQTHTRRGMRVALPDPRLQEAVDATRMALLLVDAQTDLAAFVALDRYGLNDEPAQISAAAVARGATRIVKDLRRGRDSDDLLALVGLRAAEELLRTAGESRASTQAATEAAALWIGLVREGRALERLRTLLDAASPTWTWPDDRTAAAMLLFVRDLLVREASTDDASRLDVLSLVPGDWLGQGVEVHDAPTHHGELSYAVRWHGERPALLWDRRASGDQVVTLRAPGLDPAWSTTEPSGEALLAPVAPRVGVT